MVGGDAGEEVIGLGLGVEWGGRWVGSGEWIPFIFVLFCFNFDFNFCFDFIFVLYYRGYTSVLFI